MDRALVARVCQNGHFMLGVNSDAKYCSKCGEVTINGCIQCQRPICVGPYYWMAPPPSFCTNCGKPYPWTEKKIAIAKEAVRQVDKLSDEDKAEIEKSIDSITIEGPNTHNAAKKVKTIAAKLGKQAYDIILKVITDVASESAKKILLGQ